MSTRWGRIHNAPLNGLHGEKVAIGRFEGHGAIVIINVLESKATNLVVSLDTHGVITSLYIFGAEHNHLMSPDPPKLRNRNRKGWGAGGRLRSTILTSNKSHITLNDNLLLQWPL